MRARQPVAASLFSGPGGSSYGYKQAGFDVRVAVDCAPDKWADAILDTYRANHDGTLLVQDVRETSGADVLDAAGVDRGELALLDGSPPCSPFSVANTNTDWRDHDSGTLFDEYARLVDETNPQTFVAENVPGLAQSGTKGYYKDLLARLEQAGDGYTVRPQVIDAAYLGAGQHRRRLMIIGTRSDVATPDPIEPTTSPRTVAESWGGLERDPDDVERQRQSLRESKNYVGYKRLDPGECLADVADKGWSHWKLEWADAAPTFTSRVTIQPPHETRRITIGELKRLIGLPDDYVLKGGSYNYRWECGIRCLPPELLSTIGARLREVIPDA